jgi:Holliday junction resolvase
MMNTNTKRETKKIRELAREYESKGFRVSVLPRGESVPAFLRQLNFAPDLIAVSEKESHVIEVSSRDTAERLRELSGVVDAIERKRGWDFILVMTNPRTPANTPRTLKPAPSLHDLQESLKKARSLSVQSRESGHQFSDAVLLTAWAVVEGALRMYLYSNKPEQETRAPRSIVRDAVMYGFITPEVGNFLDSLASTRNAVAHGVATATISPKLLTRLMSIAESLVTERESRDEDA